MCGICGILCLHDREMVDIGLLREMTAAQRHRGPDDDGYYNEGGVGLGFCRLAILDLTPAGHQPMTNEDSTIWLIFNGEIYNFQELLPLLEQAGHRFRSRSDSEVIIHAYEEWGADCITRFNGMFAFALWDSRTRRVLLARDRLGVKPLYYWSDGSHFAFASELKALLAYPGIPRRLNLAALQTYLTYEYVPAPESIFQGIQKLLPGHFLEIRLDNSASGRETGDWQSRKYWDVSFAQNMQGKRSEEDHIEELGVLFKNAVARRLVSDVPLGVFLSGGTDSSSVVAMMAESSPTRLKTFSIGFEEKTFNELGYARSVARHFDTEHYEELLRPDINELLQTVADALDEPFADASVLPTYLVSQMARKHVTVALAGDGGDELFAGYDWYRAQKLASVSFDRLPSSARRQLSELAGHIPPASRKKGPLNIARRFLDVANLPAEMQHTRWQTFWREAELAQLLTIEPQEHVPALDWRILDLFKASGSSKPLDQQQYADIKRYLPDDILFKVDRVSMANSLEARSPFLDYTLVEFAARLPSHLRLHNLTSKYILRQMIQSKLPYETLHRPKLGFNIPYKLWLRKELRSLLQDALAPDRLKQQGLFSPAYVQKLVTEHLDGSRDHAHKLWQLLMFQLWAERYLYAKQDSAVLLGNKSRRA
ncbi:MAG TPA: asparagine synthase (glutamine-hydrolyzing) [Ktedonobacteraceae bacterium]|nr:asparagine synthase (glutamine-hydrolyzing) [Ktedonobacteraceae bacterium]